MSSALIGRSSTKPRRCALCLEVRELQKSHIIPNAIFRRTMRKYDGKLITTYDSETGLVQRTSDTWWDYLLCKACELHLSQYEKVGIETMRATAKVIADLEQGVRIWTKAWCGTNTEECVTLPLRHNGVPYRGINILLLWGEALACGYTSNRWMTYRQAIELGAHVRKGEHESFVVYADHFTTPVGD